MVNIITALYEKEHTHLYIRSIFSNIINQFSRMLQEILSQNTN